ncbi:MAG: putative dehydrogenase [Flavobacteriales bacterium]|jgi:predicted dehydrogenase
MQDSKVLRWGILGAANIAKKAFIPAIKKSHNAQLVAIASRSVSKAEAFINDVGLEDDNVKAYGSYESLLADPYIDAIYIPTPNHLHLELSKASLSAGKHVLCEKPIALDKLQALELLEFSKGFPNLLVHEAFMYRYHPRWQRVKSLVMSGAIGVIRHIYVSFSYANYDSANVRNKPELGGGALLDIGCYGVSVARWLYDEEPSGVQSVVRKDPAFGTDTHVSALLGFSGGMASIYCSTQAQPSQMVEIIGEKGRLFIDQAFNPRDDDCRLDISVDTNTYSEEFNFSDQYLLQLNAFCGAVEQSEFNHLNVLDAIANMQVLDCIRE